jgi:OOP family OmpA-OmpF porin
MSAIVGTTALIKISDKLVFNLDFTSITNFTHHLALDGKSDVGPELSRTGSIYTTSLGLTYYFGKKDKHADWYYENKKDEIADLEARVADIEAMMNDMDKDGVPNYLDLENNTIAGVAVDTKGRAVDLNNNGIPDELEKYFDNKYNVNQNALVMGDNNVYSNAQMKSMINGGYVNVFFDFDKDKITPGTISAINFLIKYLNANPKSNADIIGYADEMGDINYNMDLAGRRAKKVKEMIVRSGISESRLNLSVKGEDNSVPKESKLARQLVRRVAFEVD